jgi:hypothetical protein
MNKLILIILSILYLISIFFIENTNIIGKKNIYFGIGFILIGIISLIDNSFKLGLYFPRINNSAGKILSIIILVLGIILLILGFYNNIKGLV